jgi:hypothetical protein
MAIAHSTASGPEPAPGYFANRISWIAEAGRLRQFWATRQAIQRGEDLFDCSKEDIANRKLMGPLTFNVYETTVAAMPGVVIGSVSRFIWPPAALSTTPLEAAIGDVTGLLVPFIVPTVALCLAWVAAWTSLLGEDRSRRNLRRARDAYLYFDGAYGLWPEAITSLWVLLFGWGSFFGGRSDLSGVLFGLVYIGAQLVGLVGTYHFYGEQLKGIPSLLFAVNGYNAASPGDSIRMLDLLISNKKEAPWRSYRWAVVVGVPIVFVLVSVCFTLVGLVGGHFLAAIRGSA